MGRKIIPIAIVILIAGSAGFYFLQQFAVDVNPKPVTRSVATTMPAVATTTLTDLATTTAKELPAEPATPTSSIAKISIAPPPIPLTTPPVSQITLRDITAKSLVGLFCHYKITDPSLVATYGDSNGEYIAKGSGVIINPQGYILTAKHIVDQQWTAWAYGSTGSDLALEQNSELNYCEVGLPTTDNLPTVSDIKSINPSITLPNPFPYVATAYFEPKQGTMSDDEYRTSDFAIMKITRAPDNCATFNFCTLPAAFPYNPVIFSRMPDEGIMDGLLNFGYPGELINTSESTFHDFYLKGSVGTLTKYYGGDAYFKDEPFNFEWSASDVLPGRSGSPIFWDGYVVGVEYGLNVNDKTIDYAIGLPAIYKILDENKLGDLLYTQ
ncbi:MAG: trypsin-like peptidase domain-containing protein [Patescibacteria group bacterium]|nr:hypothetical protein [Patescibacteria group bacterium]MDE2015685.1 trypsin-like peptidase domain-containing protein [Patescibacteria group bacterium]MDE2226742.1 trypsin-like peptidase domain-containing protein [Patescibacteria group bacterium]